MCSRYDSEYDNYRGGHMTSDAESEFPNEDIDSDVGAVLDELSLENIRQISKNITKKFGARSDKDEDSEEWGAFPVEIISKPVVFIRDFLSVIS